mmetsp:Transcript_91486/g.218052  ORF Transcript_91486/g.218052 Transcript_91486/m.218052 type:complete len:222 (+) Transcript_91486:77-742(+)
MSLEENKVDQEGHPQQARFAGGAGSLWKDHRKGVSGGAALLLEAGPDLPDLRCVWVVILPPDHFLRVRIMEVERHVDQALAAAAVASHTGAPTAGLRLQQVQSVTTLMVRELRHAKAHVAVVLRLGSNWLALRSHRREVGQTAAAWTVDCSVFGVKDKEGWAGQGLVEVHDRCPTRLATSGEIHLEVASARVADSATAARLFQGVHDVWHRHGCLAHLDSL